jgi:threonine dehydrogenase-like Zn-dependent dehydrogenase
VGQPGHEAVGRVVALGSEVANLAEGRRVCVWRDRGHDVQGCYAEYVAVDEAALIHAPGDLPPEALAPLELAMCVSAHIILAEKLDALKGKRVGVFGLGPAGLVCVQLARSAKAAEIIGFDPLAQRRELARQLGAHRVIDPKEKEGAGTLDCSFDCAGSAQAVHAAMAMTQGLVVLFAVQREAYTFKPEYWSRLVLAGARPHTRLAADKAMIHVMKGELDLGALVTHILPLSDYDRAVALLESQEALKVALIPGEK